MALLTFDSTQIGDSLISISAADYLVTPPREVAGLWRATAVLDVESRNRLQVAAAIVRMRRDTPALLHAALSAIMELLGTSGVVELFDDDGVTRMRHTDDTWVLTNVQPPEPADGFGGRYMGGIRVEFKGATDWIED